MDELFETRALIGVANQVPSAGAFLQKMFFKQEITSDSEHVDIVVQKGKRKLAPFVSPKIQGKVVTTAKKTINSYKPAYIKDKWVTEAVDVITNSNTVFYADAQNVAQRVAQKVTEEIQEKKENVIRRIEWMASKVLTTGKVEVKGDGIDDVIDFNFDASQIVVLGDDTWDNDDVNPINMMRKWRRERIQAGGIAPNVAVFGSDVIDAFLNNPNVKEALDLRRVDRGMIDPQLLPEGVTYYGYIKEIGTDIYGYDEWYIDDNGVEQPMVPTKGVIYGSTNAKGKRVYGAIKDLKAIGNSSLIATKFFVKSWEVEDPSARYILIQSAPLVVPTIVDAFMFATVL